jgi:hypothetical protein
MHTSYNVIDSQLPRSGMLSKGLRSVPIGKYCAENCTVYKTCKVLKETVTKSYHQAEEGWEGFRSEGLRKLALL